MPDGRELRDGSAAMRSTPRPGHVRSPTTCSRSSGSGAASRRAPARRSRTRLRRRADPVRASGGPAAVDWGVEGGERFTFEPGSGTYLQATPTPDELPPALADGLEAVHVAPIPFDLMAGGCAGRGPRARLVTVDPHIPAPRRRLGLGAPAGRRVPTQPRRGGGDPRWVAGGPRGGEGIGRAGYAARLREARRRGIDRLPRGRRRAGRARRSRGPPGRPDRLRRRLLRRLPRRPGRDGRPAQRASPRDGRCPASQRPITARRTRSWSIEPWRTAA